MAKIPKRDLSVCRFPKHDGKKWEDVIEEDREYVEWILEEKRDLLDNDQFEFLIELLEET